VGLEPPFPSGYPGSNPGGGVYYVGLSGKLNPEGIYGFYPRNPLGLNGQDHWTSAVYIEK